jgi:hypothetical protein
MGLGLDASGNVYVAHCGSGGLRTVLESYTAGLAVRRWQVCGLEYSNCSDIDPTTEADIYTLEGHYSFDPTRNTDGSAPGTECTYVGSTLNPFKYPDDARRHLSGVVAWVRWLGAPPQRYLFVVCGFGEMLGIYRFNSTTDGEVAIPSGCITNQDLGPAYMPELGGWPANFPTNTAAPGNSAIWRSTDGTGRFATGTWVSAWPTETNPTPAWWVDSLGDVWMALSNGFGIRQFPLGAGAIGQDRFDSWGNPIYTWESSVCYPGRLPVPATSNGPAPYTLATPTNIRRIEYDAANDIMYCLGFCMDGVNDYTDNTGPTVLPAGRILCRYPGWKAGGGANAPDLKVTSQAGTYNGPGNNVIPWDKDNQPFNSVASLAVAGGCLFLGVPFNTRAGGTYNCNIIVLNPGGILPAGLSPLQPFGEWTDFRVGNPNGSELFDVPFAARAFRSSVLRPGEYWVFAEADATIKQMLYRIPAGVLP